MRTAFVGFDLARNAFQVHAVDRAGRAIRNCKLSRSQVSGYFASSPPCTVGIEACASAHHWARELQKLGHTVRLMTPAFVQPYRKGGKNDANDAEAICEAVQRPSMRFVAVKSPEQQATLVLHRLRQQQMRNRVALINQIRGLLSEFGLIMPQGPNQLRSKLPEILEDASNALPYAVRRAMARMRDHLCNIETVIEDLDKQINMQISEDPDAQLLMKIPGVGPLTASAAVAVVGDAKAFRNGRQFAAWAGLVPRQHSSGGKTQLGCITKKGDENNVDYPDHFSRFAYERPRRRTRPLSS